MSPHPRLRSFAVFANQSFCCSTLRSRDKRHAALFRRVDGLVELAKVQICSAPQPASASLSAMSVSPLPMVGVCIDLPHIRRRLNTRHKLKRNVCESNKSHNASCRVLHPIVAHDDASHKEIECATSDEGEHEAGISRHLRGNLEFCETSE